MIFLRKIESLQHIYRADECVVQDNAFLYGVCNPKPPLATHIVFNPMPQEAMQNLVNNYKLAFPTELLGLYRVMNGADLFWTVRFVGKKKTRIPICCFSIYGVPLTYDRKHIEPYNISVEDLNRPRKTPESWLKFGSYYRPTNMIDRLDLFIDTNQSAVFAIEHEREECRVVESWSSIDNCLCSVFDLLASQKTS